ncbi:MAG TPA: hypothetical protein VEH76_01215 [Methylocystis sp.]|nr:hypothetical protein [Methylocystis sp.]
MKWSKILSSIVGAFLVLAAGSAARAAGGDGPEAMSMGNMCMVMFGYDMIHITSYLPGQSRSEYCEEIPQVGRVIMVFDIENPKFRDLPIDIRIIRDPLTPITEKTDIEALTEVHFPATMYKKGTFTFEHDYQQRGHYIGMVTLTKDNGEKDTQIFKFSVGETLWGWLPYILGAILIALVLAAYWKHSHPSKPKVEAVKSPA